MGAENSQSAGRLIGYARVSTEAQTLASQLDALNAAKCETIFEDHGVSGAKSKRPGLDAMLASLQPSDTVVVFKLDRLGRSVAHLADLLTHFEQNGIHFCSLTEGIDTTTPGGKLVYHIFSAIAEFTRDLIREQTLAGLQSAKARGITLGRPRSLSPDQLNTIAEALADGTATKAELARRYGVSRVTIERGLKGMKFPVDDHA